MIVNNEGSNMWKFNLDISRDTTLKIQWFLQNTR